MKQLRVFFVLAFLFAIVPSVSQADSVPEPRTTAWGNGLKYIEWSDAFESDGLRVIMGERLIPASPIPTLVQNITDETMVGLRLRIVWTSDEYKQADSEAWVYPSTLEPGDVGFVGADADIASFPTDYGEFHVYRLSRPNPKLDSIVTLRVTQGTVSERADFTGNVANQSDTDVREIEAHWICIEKNGIPSDYGLSIVQDIRVLRAGDHDTLEVSLDNLCSDSYLIVFTGQVRE